MKLRYGYVASSCVIGFILLFNFIAQQPDGKLHIVFCDVGQGDSVYIRFPNGEDMLLDGGPDERRVIGCLSRHMAFWDRTVSMVILSHPHADHWKGLLSVLSRYSIPTFISTPITRSSSSLTSLWNLVQEKHIDTKLFLQHDGIRIGDVSLTTLWPTDAYLAAIASEKQMPYPFTEDSLSATDLHASVLGVSEAERMNETSLVLFLRYGSFQALFPADADTIVETSYMSMLGNLGEISVLKVPHQGSKTAMSDAFVSLLKPRFAVIPVGKNTYGHPAPETIAQLTAVGSVIYRTDISGDVEIVSDGQRFWVKTGKN